MKDFIGLAFFLLIVVGGLYLLTRPTKPLTVEEFEKRANENRGMMGAGMLGLQKVLDPAAEKAIAAQEDFRQGYLDGEQESGEGGDDDDEGENTKAAERDGDDPKPA
jgi:hypothetical protein